jgi:hypothetical protein
MIKTMTAFTDEVDDAEFAVEEILGQLDMDGLLKSTVGLVAFGRDFVETGTLKAISESLPFPVLGCATNACAVKGSEGMTAPLSLLVMTSDDVTFRPGLTCDLTEDLKGDLRRAWDEAAEGQSGPPALVLGFMPLLSRHSGATLLEGLSDTACGVPVFGTICVTEERNYVSARIFHEGEFHQDRVAMVLVYGDVKPKFFLGTVSEEKYFKSKGVITGVRDGAVLSTVSGKAARDFLMEVGLSADDNGQILQPFLFPIAIDLNDGATPVLRAMLTTLEDGSMTLAGDVPVGATLSVTNIDAEEVALVSRKTLESIANEAGRSAVLLYSCAARYHVAEAFDSELEIGIVRECLDDKGGYLIGFSGGEICPVPALAGAFENRYHNFTIIACVI